MITEINPARPMAVVALGGNALVRRGEPVDAASQSRAVIEAARLIAEAAQRWRLAIAHGNGPQVGLLALLHESCTDEPYPLDVLDAETEGQIGYSLDWLLCTAIAGSVLWAVELKKVVVRRTAR